jgi:Tfp pilus assembly protein PilP
VKNLIFIVCGRNDVKKMPKVVVALGGALILAACAGGVQKDLSAEAIVRDRASERWKLLVEGRLESAYNYQTPEYREIYDFKHFRRKFGTAGMWSKAPLLLSLYNKG